MSKQLEFIGFDGVEIDISDERENWLDKSLVIKNCPNLLSIDASNCGLKELIIENCRKVQKIEAYSNNLTELKIKNFPKLVSLFVNFNKLTKLEIKKTPKLKVLHCDNNQLKELEIFKMKKLENLFCHKNKDLQTLDLSQCSGLIKLAAQECSLKEVLLSNSPELNFLDLAENKLDKINLVNNNNLETLSLRDNYLKEINLKGKDKLERLVISNNYFPPTDLKVYLALRELKYLKAGVFLPNDISLEEAKIRFERYHKFNELSNAKAYQELKKKLSGFSLSSPSLVGKKLAEREKEGRKESKWADGFQETNLEIIPLSKYKIPSEKNNIFNLDLSWQRLGGKLVIEDWTNLKKLNLGHNEIAELEIRNCPSLQWLNYSYNALTKEEIIEGCSLLTPENTFSGHKSDYVLPDDFVPNTPIHDEITQEKEQEIKEDKINYDITLEYLESLTYEELLELDKDTIPRDLIITTAKIFTNKFKAKQSKQETENLQKINNLVTKAQKFLKKGNLKEVDKVLAQIKSYCNTDSYKKNQTLIRKLEQSLNQIKLQQAKFHEPTNSNSFIISISVLSVIILALLAKILQDKIKNFLKKSLKLTNEFKRKE